MKIVAEPRQGPNLPPGAEPAEPLVAALVEEIDPQAANRSPSESPLMPASIRGAVKPVERIGLGGQPRIHRCGYSLEM